MSLIKTMADQVGLSFTGRINILEEKTGKFLGNINLKQGLIVFSRFREKIGIPSLYHCLIEDLEGDFFKYAVEPELISSHEMIFELPYENFLKKGQKLYQNYKLAKKYRPSSQLHLALNPDFIEKGSHVSAVEFKVMSIIAEHGLVEDVFRYSSLFEYQIVNALVSLRQKKAIRVVE